MRDLLVIGGGPGGYTAAIRASQLGMKVCLTEKEAFGGTCLNRGCIPTKAYYKNAEALQSMVRMKEFNVETGRWFFDMPGARQRKDDIVHKMVTGIKNLLTANQVELITGEASLIGPGRVSVNGEIIEARNILIATGSVNAAPAIPGADLPGVVSSTEMLELSAVPPRLTIIGGGVIGCEFACIFRTFGSEVTILEAAPNILGTLDGEIAKRMNVLIKKQGIQIFSGITVQRIEKGGHLLKIVCEGNKGSFVVESENVLMATGRRPCTSGLNLDKLNISTDKGFIQVDDKFRTTAPGIYAIGDVIGGPMLAHVASEEGKAAVENMAGLVSRVPYHAVPSCIFSFPEAASVGMTQEEAQRKEIKYKVGKFQIAANGKAMTMGERDGLVKVLADEADRIIGFHIIGPHASDLILEAALMVKERLTIDQVREVIHPHPTLGEALLEAVMDLRDEAIHLMPAKK